MFWIWTMQLNQSLFEDYYKREKMKDPGSMAASLIIVLVFCPLLSVSADTQQQNLTAHPGDDVTLSCQAPNNVAIVAVEWSRPGLEKHVYLKSDGHLNTADQDESYKNRTQLEDDEMKNGDLSLVLEKVNYTDGGTYECRYVEERGGRRKRADQRKLRSIIHLTVEELQPQNITAQSGHDVTLSCQALNTVAIATVEWIRSDLKRHVYSQRDGQVQTADQDPSYKNRVQLKDDEMKNGDLSLVLKKVTSNDGGTYECLYVEKRGGRKRAVQMKPISKVYLTVEGPGDGEQGGGGQRGGDEEGGGQSGRHLAVILTGALTAAVAVGLAAGVGFVIYRKRRRRSGNNPDQPGDVPDVIQQLEQNETSQRNELCPLRGLPPYRGEGV